MKLSEKKLYGSVAFIIVLFATIFICFNFNDKMFWLFLILLVICLITFDLTLLFEYLENLPDDESLNT